MENSDPAGLCLEGKRGSSVGYPNLTLDGYSMLDALPDPFQPLIWPPSNTRLPFSMLCQMNTTICVHETDSHGKCCPRQSCAVQSTLTTSAPPFPCLAPWYMVSSLWSQNTGVGMSIITPLCSLRECVPLIARHWASLGVHITAQWNHSCVFKCGTHTY